MYHGTYKGKILQRNYSITCLKQPVKNRHNQGLNGKLELKGGRKLCRMLPLEHSAIFLTSIKR